MLTTNKLAQMQKAIEKKLISAHNKNNHCVPKAKYQFKSTTSISI